jgi:hypothetical protein
MTKTIQSLHKYPNAHNMSYHGRDIQGNIWSHQLLFFLLREINGKLMTKTIQFLKSIRIVKSIRMLLWTSCSSKLCQRNFL